MSDNVMKDTVVSRRSTGAISKFSIGEYHWVWIGTVAVFLLSYIIAPGSLRASALLAMLPFAGILAVVAIGQTLVIQQRGIDMSAAGMFSLGGMIVSILVTYGWGLFFGIATTLFVAFLFGALNGLLVTRVNIAPIVTTLATNALMIGCVRWISSGTPIQAPSGLGAFAHQSIAGLPFSFIFSICLVTAAAIVMNYTIYGKRFVAVGVSPVAADNVGIRVTLYQIGAYAFATICFALGGMMFAGFIGSATHTAGNDYLLPGVAAVVVGGTPFTGGRGSVIASAMAAIFITQLGQMVLSLGASAATQLLVQAGAIFLAATVRHLPTIVKVLSMRN